jgi:hypothetical protein
MVAIVNIPSSLILDTLIIQLLFQKRKHNPEKYVTNLQIFFDINDEKVGMKAVNSEKYVKKN